MLILRIIGFIILLLIAVKLIAIVGWFLRLGILIVLIAAVVWLARSIFGTKDKE